MLCAPIYSIIVVILMLVLANYHYILSLYVAYWFVITHSVLFAGLTVFKVSLVTSWYSLTCL